MKLGGINNNLCLENKQEFADVTMLFKNLILVSDQKHGLEVRTVFDIGHCPCSKCEMQH